MAKSRTCGKPLARYNGVFFCLLPSPAGCLGLLLGVTHCICGVAASTVQITIMSKFHLLESPMKGRGKMGGKSQDRGIRTHGREWLVAVFKAFLFPLWPEALERRRIQGLSQLPAVYLPLPLECPLPHTPSSPLPLDRILRRQQGRLRCNPSLRRHPTVPKGY